MATSKITIKLQDDQVEEIRALVAAGKAASVSAFVQHAVGVALFDAAGWKEMLEEARLCRLIRQAGTDLIALDGPDATAVGLLLARTATADIVDAHVVFCAQRAGQAVVTSDAGDLRRIAPELRLVAV